MENVRLKLSCKKCEIIIF